MAPPTWDRVRTFSTVVQTGNPKRPGSIVINNYNNQALARDYRPTTASNRGTGLRRSTTEKESGPAKGLRKKKFIFNRFLPPLPYHRAGYSVTSHAYNYAVSGTPLDPYPLRRRWGSQTPVDASVGPGASFAAYPLTGAQLLPPNWTNGESEAITKALSKVSVAKVNYSLAVVEAHKSFETVSRRVVQLARAIRLVRRLQVNGKMFASRVNNRHTTFTALTQAEFNRRTRLIGHDIRRDRKELRRMGLGIKQDVTSGNVLLEYNYGWRPLLSDIYGVAQQLANGIGGKRETFYVIHSSTRDVPAYGKPSGVNHWEYHSTLKHGIKVRLDYRLDDEDVAAHRARLLGLDNPFVLAWELIPWSFVVDWVLPVGTALSGLTASFGVTFRAGSCTNWVKGSHECSYTYNDGGVALDGVPHKISSNVFCARRTVIAGSPLPRIYIKSPFARLSDTQTLNRLASAYALLGQVLR